MHFARRADLGKSVADVLTCGCCTLIGALQVVQFVNQGDHSLFFPVKFRACRVRLLNQRVLRRAGFNGIDAFVQVRNGLFQFFDDALLDLDAFNDFLRCVVHRVTASNNGIRKALNTAQCFFNRRVHLVVVHNGRKGQCAPVYICHISTLKNLHNSKSYHYFLAST